MRHGCCSIFGISLQNSCGGLKVVLVLMLFAMMVYLSFCLKTSSENLQLYKLVNCEMISIGVI